MNCIDITSKWSKMLLCRKTFETTQNCKSNQITMNCIDITSKWSKMLLCRKTFQTTENYKSDQIGRQNEQNDELRRKTFKTTQNYKSDQNTMTCIDLMSERSKQRKTPNAIKLRWICIDLTSKRSKMLSYVANHSKPLNYKSDQNTMTFTDLMSKTSKQRKTAKVIKLQRIASI